MQVEEGEGRTGDLKTGFLLRAVREIEFWIWATKTGGYSVHGPALYQELFCPVRPLVEPTPPSWPALTPAAPAQPKIPSKSLERTI